MVDLEGAHPSSFPDTVTFGIRDQLHATSVSDDKIYKGKNVKYSYVAIAANDWNGLKLFFFHLTDCILRHCLLYDSTDFLP